MPAPVWTECTEVGAGVVGLIFGGVILPYDATGGPTYTECTTTASVITKPSTVAATYTKPTVTDPTWTEGSN